MGEEKVYLGPFWGLETGGGGCQGGQNKVTLRFCGISSGKYQNENLLEKNGITPDKMYCVGLTKCRLIVKPAELLFNIFNSVLLKGIETYCCVFLVFQLHPIERITQNSFGWLDQTDFNNESVLEESKFFPKSQKNNQTCTEKNTK